MHNRAGIEWIIPSGQITHDQALLAVTMDIRREPQILNRLLGCSNFVAIPETLREIRRNTTKKRRRVKKK